MSLLRDRRRARSEELALHAEQASSREQRDEAARLFAEAAALESQVAREVPTAQARLRSILAISSMALWYKSGDFDQAESEAYWFLSRGEGLTAEGKRDLCDLLERCWREREIQKRIGRNSELVPLEVRVEGSAVSHGLAPVQTTRDVSQLITSALTRTAELRLGAPFRDRGLPGPAFQAAFRIFEAPAFAGSYVLRFYLASGPQPTLPGIRPLDPSSLVANFLELARAAERDAARVAALVPESRYREAILRCFRDVAPDGRSVSQLSLGSSTWKLAKGSATLRPEHRVRLTEAIIADLSIDHPIEETGTLMAVNLKAKRPSFTIVRDGDTFTFHARPGRFDDTIGPMLKQTVRVTGRTSQGPQGRRDLEAKDIQVIEAGSSKQKAAARRRRVPARDK